MQILGWPSLRATASYRLVQLDRFGCRSTLAPPWPFRGRGGRSRQAEAIARSTEQCLAAQVPIIAAIVGEGGSGGAVAIAAANRVLMFEHAVYSVISPEGCASILWRTADKASEAAEAMRITASDLQALGVVDRIVAEPVGGAHRDPEAAIGSLKGAIMEELDSYSTSSEHIRAQRGRIPRIGDGRADRRLLRRHRCRIVAEA